jgi:hypothetical protein
LAFALAVSVAKKGERYELPFSIRSVVIRKRVPDSTGELFSPQYVVSSMKKQVSKIA